MRTNVAPNCRPCSIHMLTKMGHLSANVRSGVRTKMALKYACPILVRTYSVLQDQDLAQFSFTTVRERECAHNHAVTRHASLVPKALAAGGLIRNAYKTCQKSGYPILVRTIRTKK